MSWAWPADGRREHLGIYVEAAQRRLEEVSCSMEILEQRAGVPTSFCRHGDAIAELHRKPFDQRMMEKEHIVSGSEDGGG